jgi:antitoxin VapB
VALNIKNDETQRLSRELASATGETVTAAVTIAVRERLDRIRSGTEGADQRAARILAIGRQIASALPEPRMRVEDLYDERGLPA